MIYICENQKGNSIFSCFTWTAETGVFYADCYLNSSQEKSCEWMNGDERQTWSNKSKNIYVSKGLEIISCSVNTGEKRNRMRLSHGARNSSECMSWNPFWLVSGNVNSSESYVVVSMYKDKRLKGAQKIIRMSRDLYSVMEIGLSCVKAWRKKNDAMSRSSIEVSRDCGCLEQRHFLQLVESKLKISQQVRPKSACTSFQKMCRQKVQHILSVKFRDLCIMQRVFTEKLWCSEPASKSRSRQS